METKQVILIHGLHQYYWIMKPLANQLERLGFTPHTFGYDSLKKSINQHTYELYNWLQKVIGSNNFHVVAHSLGGLVIRQFIHNYPDYIDQIKNIVTLGTPHQGSTTAGYVKRLFPLMIGKSYKGALDGNAPDLPEKITLGVIAGNKPIGLGQFFLKYHDHMTNNPIKQDHDGTVYVSETLLSNATDHIILPITHTGMLIDKEVVKQTAQFLEHGLFKR